MRLTLYTDYALRVLIYLGAHPGKVSSIAEIARAYGISQNHLMKVVHDLRKAGYVKSVRGRFGGVRLARPADKISVGAVVRDTEDDLQLVDCARCVIAPACGLTGVLGEALVAFMTVLDGYRVDDLIGKRADLIGLLDPGRAKLSALPSIRGAPVPDHRKSRAPIPSRGMIGEPERKAAQAVTVGPRHSPPHSSRHRRP